MTTMTTAAAAAAAAAETTNRNKEEEKGHHHTPINALNQTHSNDDKKTSTTRDKDLVEVEEKDQQQHISLVSKNVFNSARKPANNPNIISGSGSNFFKFFDFSNPEPPAAEIANRTKSQFQTHHLHQSKPKNHILLNIKPKKNFFTSNYNNHKSNHSGKKNNDKDENGDASENQMDGLAEAKLFGTADIQSRDSLAPLYSQIRSKLISPSPSPSPIYNENIPGSSSSSDNQRQHEEDRSLNLLQKMRLFDEQGGEIESLQDLLTAPNSIVFVSFNGDPFLEGKRGGMAEGPSSSSCPSPFSAAFASSAEARKDDSSSPTHLQHHHDYHDADLEEHTDGSASLNTSVASSSSASSRPSIRQQLSELKLRVELLELNAIKTNEVIDGASSDSIKRASLLYLKPSSSPTVLSSPSSSRKERNNNDQDAENHSPVEEDGDFHRSEKPAAGEMNKNDFISKYFERVELEISPKNFDQKFNNEEDKEQGPQQQIKEEEHRAGDDSSSSSSSSLRSSNSSSAKSSPAFHSPSIHSDQAQRSAVFFVENRPHKVIREKQEISSQNPKESEKSIPLSPSEKILDHPTHPLPPPTLPLKTTPPIPQLDLSANSSIEASPSHPRQSAPARKNSAIVLRLKSKKKILAFVNSRSGGGKQLAKKLQAKLQRYLPAGCIFDLADPQQPAKALLENRSIQDQDELTVLICGGDGTVNFLLDSIDKIFSTPLLVPESGGGQCRAPSVAILPLGTANDLSRVFRWGSGYTGAGSTKKLLASISEASRRSLDRWKVTITDLLPAGSSGNSGARNLSLSECREGGTKEYLGDEEMEIETPVHTERLSKYAEENSSIIDNVDGGAGDRTQRHQLPSPYVARGPSKVVIMNNYFSVGMDARIALNFHKLRQKRPNVCSTRAVNKFWYFNFGFSELLSIKSERNVSASVEIFVDGVKVSLGKFQAVVIVNLPSYAGGCNLFGSVASANAISEKNASGNPDGYAAAAAGGGGGGGESGFVEQSVCDGLIEVVGILNITHLTSIETKLSHGFKLAQGRRISILYHGATGFGKESKSANGSHASMAFQIDGEPFEKKDPVEIEIEFYKQAELLLNERKI